MAEPTTIIGEFTSVQGNLQGDEDLQVFGRVEGAIQLDRTLLIEPSGVVKADVSVRNAVVSGVVIGNVEATESVRLTAEGRMVGDIAAPRVIIVEGALFKGRVDMGEVEPSMSKPSKSEPAPVKRAAPTRGATRPAARPARTTEPALPSRIRAAKTADVEPDEEEEVVESEEKPKTKPVRRRTTRTAKAPPKAESSAADRETASSKPPPPKPRVAPRKRRVSVKKKR